MTKKKNSSNISSPISREELIDEIKILEFKRGDMTEVNVK